MREQQELTVATDSRSEGAIELLSLDRLEAVWPKIEEMLDRVPHTWEDWTKETLHDMAMCQRLQVWAIGTRSHIRMVVISQVAIYPAGRILEVFWGAGEGRVWEYCREVVDATLERFAVVQGCRRIDIIGRGGWEPILRNSGFRRSRVVFSRPVVHRGMQ